MVSLKAYAKINLALEVLGTEGGYHKVNNIMVPVSIADEIQLERNADTFVVNDRIPDNICVTAAKAFFEEFKIPAGVKITLNKRIPMMSGLAGGSSDAAAVIKGLAELYRVKEATPDRLLKVAAKVGSDVAFFIESKAALCTGHGEIIEPLGFDVPTISVLLIKPSVGLSTANVYKKFRYAPGTPSKMTAIDAVKDALKNGDIEKLNANVFNDLETPAFELSKELKLNYDLLKNAGYNVHLTGSGPTLYILNPTIDDIDKIRDMVDPSAYMTLVKTK